MRITDLLHRESIALAGAADKYAAIDQMVALMAKAATSTMWSVTKRRSWPARRRAPPA